MDVSSLPLLLTIQLPDWVVPWVRKFGQCNSDTARMRMVIDLARENVLRQTGGPFAAAVFDATGQLVSVGVNRVVPAQNSILHAEILALMLAHARLGTYSLGSHGCELVSSCDPCAMCLGATLWSGVRRLLCGADRQAASDAGFEEGPVFPESFDYLQRRGITVVRGCLAAEAADVFRLYHQLGGVIYNGSPSPIDDARDAPDNDSARVTHRGP
jgi:tRNA(Arg) A34 adenosine deaminase TadA